MLVNALRVEKKHLESTLKENVELKETFRAKNDELQLKYEEIFKECEHYKRQVVGIDELRKDRDERLGQLRKEIDDLTQKNETLEKTNAKLDVNNQSLKQTTAKVQAELADLTQQLQMANQVRSQCEDSLAELQKNYSILQGAYNERDRLMGTFKTRYEDEAKKFAESERNVSALEIQKKAMDK